MKRRVIKHGPSLIISLPAKWVKKYGIQKGDELSVEDQEKTLLVIPEKTRVKKTITTDLTNLEPWLISRFLARSYQKGFDETSIKYSSMEAMEVIKSKVHELMGFEIIEQDDSHCLIRSLAADIELDFDHSLKRAFYLVKDVLDTCIEAYSNKQTDVLKNLHLRDFEVNRFCYFCLRYINKQYYMNPENTRQSHVLYYLIEILEDLGDNFKRNAKYLATISKDEQILIFLKQLKILFDLSQTYFYKPTKDIANKSYRRYKELKEQIKNHARECTGEKVLILQKISEAAGILYHFTTMRLDSLGQISE
jgi:phosphate uptake regulator